MVSNQRGDTLVEVLVAIVVLGMVIVGAITIMTRGLAAGQQALEHSQVRQSVASQIQMLQILRDQYAANPASVNGSVWASIVSTSNEQPIDYTNDCTVTSAKSASAFYLQNTGTQIQQTLFDPTLKPVAAAQPGQGLWIETIRSHEDPSSPSNSIRPGYIDFVVRACWQGVGSAVQEQTVTGTRLYDPSRP